MLRNEPYFCHFLARTQIAIHPLKYLSAGGERAVLLRQWSQSVCLGSVTRADHRKFGVFFCLESFLRSSAKRVEKFPRDDGLTRQDQRAARRTMYLRLLNNESICLISPPFLPSGDCDVRDFRPENALLEGLMGKRGRRGGCRGAPTSDIILHASCSSREAQIWIARTRLTVHFLGQGRSVHKRNRKQGLLHQI